MKHNLAMSALSIAVIAFLPIQTINAATFSVDGISYQTLSETECEVARQNTASVQETLTRLEGKLIIPQSVTDSEGHSYAVTGIANYAFVNCTNLLEITLPSTLTTIGNSSFSKCPGLTSVTIASTLLSVGPNCFSESKGITDVYATCGIDAWLASEFKDASSNPISNGARLNISGYEASDILRIPEGTKRIGGYTFAGYRTDEAYGGNVVALYLPQGIECIGKGAFERCKIENVAIGEPAAFQNYPIINLSDYCKIDFENYTANPLYNGASLTYRNPEKEYTVTDIEIPEGTPSIGRYAFIGYKQATSVSTPPSLTSIGVQAFSNCSNIKSLIIGENVAEIGMSAFSGVNLTSIESLAVTPPSFSNNSFSNETYNKANVIVPYPSIDAYKTHLRWSKFKNYDLTTNSIDDIESNNKPTIRLTGNTVHVYGANTGSVITIYGITGETVYKGYDRAITLDKKGLFILSIEGDVFKFVI